MRKTLLYGLGCAFSLLLLSLAGAGWYLGHADLKPLLERQVSKSLGRPLRLGSLALHWKGRTVTVRIDDLHLANAVWSEQPDLLQVAHLEAELALLPLLKGVLRYEHMHADGVAIQMERSATGVGNWKFAGGGTGGGLAIIPHSRAQFPTLDDFELRDFHFEYRNLASGGQTQIDLARVAMATTGADSGVRLEAEGRYLNTDLRLEATGASYAVLRGDAPYPTAFDLHGADSKIHFAGTVESPLDFDGLKGDAVLEGTHLSSLERLLDTTLPDIAWSAKSPFAKTADRWSLSQLVGHLATSPFAGSFTFNEGGVGRNDDLETSLRFANLDLDRIFPAQKSTAPSTGKLIPDTGIALPDRKALALDARIAADRLRYRQVGLTEAAAHVRIMTNQITVDGVHLKIGSGTLNGEANLRLDGRLPGGIIQARAIRLPIAEVLALAGVARDAGSGTLSGDISMSGQGDSWTRVADTARGHVTAFAENAELPRSWLDAAAFDVRALGGKTGDRIAVDCFIGNLVVDQGIGRFEPLLLDTTDHNLTGTGQIDWRSETIDLRIRSSAKRPTLGLQAPVRVTGPLRNPTIAPEAGVTGAQVGGAILLGIIATPLAALLPFLEPGFGGDSKCLAQQPAAEIPRK